MAGSDSFFLREKIKNVFSMGIEKLLIDMDGVPYIDSTGVGFLVSTHTSLTQDGGHLKLLKVKPKILEVFKVMNLLSVFEIFDDEETAMKSFTAKKASTASVASVTKKKKSARVEKEAK